MTFLVQRLAELERHLAHLRELRSRVPGPEALRNDLSLHNDVLFSLLTVCQRVIDIAGELSARRRLAFEDYTEAVRNLAGYEQLEPRIVESLERLPGFRNVLIHGYVSLDFDRVVEALHELEPISRLAAFVASLEAQSSGS